MKSAMERFGRFVAKLLAGQIEREQAHNSKSCIAKYNT